MKNVFKIKTIQRIAGIIAFAAIVGFTMAACNDITKPETTKQTPVASDYTFGNLNQTAGSVTDVTITPKSGKSTGAVSNIKYAGSATIPQTAGTYAVTFDVAAASGWNAASGLSAGNLIVNPAGGNQTDNPQNPTAADFDIGNLTQTVGSVTAVTITPKSGKSGGVITVYYNGLTALPSAVGTYPVTFDVAATSGWNAATSLSAGTLVIAEPTPSDPTPGKPTPGIDTTALDAVIQEAEIAKDGVRKASNASEVATGLWWVTESAWNAFDIVYKTAVETKVNPSSQAAVDAAKTNLQAALITFNATKKDGTGAAITLSGTITVKNNGQLVPFILLQAHNDDWSWSEEIGISLTGENIPWSRITKSLSSPLNIVFDIIGFDNDKYDHSMLFTLTVEDLQKTVHNTDVNDININLDLNLITISGTFNLNNNGQTIPSVRININRKDNNVGLGGIDIVKAGNNTPWSILIPPQAVDTDVVFSIIGFDGPLAWQYDQLFGLWFRDFGVKVGNQNKSGIALNFITVSGTVNVTYQGSLIPIVHINIDKKVSEGNYEYVSGTTLNNPSANAPWSIIIPAFTSDTEIKFFVAVGDNEDNLLWNDVTTRIVKDTNATSIALNLISISGTITVTYNGGLSPIVRIHIDKKVSEGNYEYVNATILNSPSANSPWSVFIPAFTSDTEIRINVGVGDNEDDLKWNGVTRTVKNTNISGIALNLGDITD